MMISKRQIEKYFKSISPDALSQKKGWNDLAKRQVYEYMVQNYASLDQGARIFADLVFDALDRTVQEKIDSLPKGPERRVLARKLSMVQGKRSPIPVLYLDTPVLDRLIKFELGQPVPEKAKVLFEKIRQLVESRRLVYLEDTFHREVLQMGGLAAREGMDVIRKFSKTLSFRHSQTIEDAQVLRAIQAHINGNGPLNYRRFWTDALTKQAVLSILKQCSSVAFHHQDAVTQRSPVQTEQRQQAASSQLKIRFDPVALKDDRALLKRCARHLRDLVRLGMRYETMAQHMSEANLAVFWSKQKTDLSVVLWNHLGGNPKGLAGLASFYESDAFKKVPAMRIKRDIWTAFSERQARGLERVTGPSDIAVLSAVLPYTDIMILGPRMAHVVREVLNLHWTFDTEILSMDEHEKALTALNAAPDCGED